MQSTSPCGACTCTFRLEIMKRYFHMLKELRDAQPHMVITVLDLPARVDNQVRICT